MGEFTACHVWVNLDGVLECDVSGIQALVHLHDGYAGLTLSVHNGAFDGGGAAVLGEQGGVDVPGAFSGGVEGVGTQDLAVSGDYQGVEARDLCGGLGDAGRLADGEAGVVGERGYWGGYFLAAAAFTGVGLRDHQADVVVGRDQASKHGGGEVGRAGEGYVHGISLVPLAVLGEEAFAPLAHGRLAGGAVGAVQDQHTVEMVYLVL